MSNHVELNLTITMPGGGETTFVIHAHLSKAVGERLIEAAFYEKHGSGVPEGEHHELEVMSPAVWDHPHSAHVHYHRTPSGRNFVCWAGALPTMKKVQWVAMLWCVGTVYTMATGKDFNPEYGSEPKTFFERMRTQGISVSKII